MSTSRFRVLRVAVALAIFCGFAPSLDPGLSTGEAWLPGPHVLEAQEVPAPAEVIGFEPGTPHELADFGQLEAYYRAVAEASDRMELEVIGRTHQGRDLLLLYVSSPENLRNLDRWREISERLGRAHGLTDREARELAAEGRAVVWIDHGMHSHEPAHAQSAPRLVHHLATDDSPETRRILDDVVLLLMPNINPDGHAGQVV